MATRSESTFKDENVSALISRGSDLAIVLGVTAVIALLILPVPFIVLDGLIAFNILIGVILILISIYISDPTDFTTFPSILLVTTLYRLALSIATTRIILTTAHAGHIIDVFGNLTAGGNLVVGLVIFLIITIVQFIVIAKGAERVGEVAARFSLDAMPGKQMSIDSDLRAGLVDRDEARRRRRLLELESKLHGSLDGAMKFVKGDAIAGLVIVVINLLGGLTVGVLQQHMSIGEAIQTYSVLTIGDGMVTQIPALLSAMASGLIVTRISDEGKTAHLAEAVQQQLAQKPRVPLMAGLLCWGLALVPGFPGLVFATLGSFCVAAGVFLDPALRKEFGRRSGPFAPLFHRAGDGIVKESTSPQSGLDRVQPLVLELSASEEDLDGRELVQALDIVLDGFKRTVGLQLPTISLVRTVKDGPLSWRLLAFDVWIGGGELLEPDSVLDLGDGVHQTLRRNLALFVGMQETAALLQCIGNDHPEVTREIARVLSLMRVAEVLRLLVEEEVPIRSLHLILETLADAGQREKDGAVLSALARIAISRQIVGQYANEGELKAIALGARLEQQLRSALQTSGAVPQLGLDPSVARGLIQSIGEAAQTFNTSVLVVPQDLRRPLRKLIAVDLFDVAVLAYPELKPPLRLTVLGQVAVPAAQSVGIAA
jgi:type III secretion protein V